MVNYLEALTFPLKDKEDILNFLIAGAINIFWYLLLPFVFVLGFVSRYISQVVNMKIDIPSFNTKQAWIETIKKGLGMTAVIFLYVLIPMLIIQVATVVSGSPTYAAFDEIGFQENISTTSLSLFLVGSILFLAVLFFLPMAMVQYAVTGKIREGFNLGAILYRITSNFWQYVLAQVISFITFIAMLFLIGLVPLIGGVFMLYYILFVMHIYSQIYMAAGEAKKEYEPLY